MERKGNCRGQGARGEMEQALLLCELQGHLPRAEEGLSSQGDLPWKAESLLLQHVPLQQATLSTWKIKGKESGTRGKSL